MQVVLLGDDGSVSPFLQVLGQDTSELTGLAFTPAGDRLYFSSQRGGSSKTGITTRSPARFVRSAGLCPRTAGSY